MTDPAPAPESPSPRRPWWRAPHRGRWVLGGLLVLLLTAWAARPGKEEHQVALFEHGMAQLMPGKDPQQLSEADMNEAAWKHLGAMFAGTEGSSFDPARLGDPGFVDCWLWTTTSRGRVLEGRWTLGLCGMVWVLD